MDRRTFIKLMGLGAVSSLIVGCDEKQAEILETIGTLKAPKLQNKKTFNFTTVAPTAVDDLVLPEGFSYDLIRSWGDDIGYDYNLQQGLKFGFNNDYTACFPLEDKDSALLWVNHETIDPQYIPDEVTQRKSVGGSVLKIKRGLDGQWSYVEDTHYNRRFDANSFMRVSGPASVYFDSVYGTLANCGGGKTPWNTVLTCEENYHYFDEKYGWANYNRKHYGWVVEIDPYDKNSVPVKHSAMGRFAHENAGVTQAKDGRVVVYMGDDKEDEHIYKFVSYSSDSLTEGDLYVAKMYADKSKQKVIKPSLEPAAHNTVQGYGEWELLDLSNPKLRARFFDQGELLINTREAAKIVNASPLDRPEDVEVSPYDGSVYVALTRNTKGKKNNNHFGSILRIVEHKNDPLAMDFAFSNYLVGGEDFGFACPDNMAFDDKGNLWFTTDISGDKMNHGKYEFHGNNSLFVVPLTGRDAGVPKRFASAPLGAELTGPSFSPDYKTLFLSVQHPGEDGTVSKWPYQNGKSKFGIPKSSVVAIGL